MTKLEAVNLLENLMVNDTEITDEARSALSMAVDVISKELIFAKDNNSSHRLTKRGAVSQKDINELLEYSNENQFGPNNAYYKLKQYEDLEEDGLLMRLPIKIPGIVYKLEKHYTACSLEGIEYDEIDCDCGCLYFGTSSCDSKKQYRIKEEFIRSLSSLAIVWSTVGKIRFATREEAEARIKELESREVEK